MKPGDLIEWRYQDTQRPVVENEELWSSIEKRWVPIGEKALLISLVDDVMTYLCSKGLFRARVDDMHVTGRARTREGGLFRARVDDMKSESHDQRW